MQENHGLRQSLTWVQGTPMTIGAVLGSGILVLPAVTADIAGPAALAAWLVMSVLSFPLALTLGALAAKIPHAGGIVAYTREAFGPSAGAVVGWLFLGTIPVGVPIVSLIGASYIGAVLGLSQWDITLIAAAVLTLSIILNFIGIKLSGWIQVTVIALIAGLLALAVLAAFPHVRSASFVPFAPHGWTSIGLCAVMIFWCFVGWEMIAHLAEEFKNPRRDVPLSLGLAALVIAVLYLSVAFVTIGTKAYGGQRSGAPLSALVGIGWGHMASSLTAVLALVIAFATVHTNIAGFSRMIYAQARHGDFPRPLARLHARFQTPVTALVSLAVVFAAVLLADLLFRPDLGSIIKWPSAIFIVLYIAAMASGVRLLARFSFSWWLSVIALIFCIVIYCFSGWAMLFPLGLCALGWVMTRRLRKV